MQSVYGSRYEFESRAKMLIEVSGKITCKACNALDCDAVTENIFVSGKETFLCLAVKFIVYCYFNNISYKKICLSIIIYFRCNNIDLFYKYKNNLHYSTKYF